MGTSSNIVSIESGKVLLYKLSGNIKMAGNTISNERNVVHADLSEPGRDEKNYYQHLLNKVDALA